jgi:hypothetical protein
VKVAISVCFCLLVAARVNAGVTPEARYLAFAQATVEQIENPGYCKRRACNFTYVVPTTVDPQARNALASIRKVVAPSDVPESAKVAFSGNIEIDKLQIVGDAALVEGNFYPYGHNSLNCGQEFSFPFKYINNVWVPQQWTMRGC